jgi:predicted O-linked N-acetylglucosamine transferase (SPINDLY family)
MKPAQDATAALAQAVALHQQGRLADAAPLYRKILESAPRHFDALHMLGVIEYQQGRADEAIRLIGAALAVNPKVADAHSHFGNALQAQKRFDDAIASYDRALKIAPDHVDAMLNRGSALRALGRFGDALDCYARIVAIKPDHARAVSFHGACLKALGRHAEAVESYDRALALAPGDADLRNNRANVLLDLKRFDDAVAGYDRALAIRPAFAEAHNNRGNALQELGRFDDALDSYDRSVAIAPGYADAHANRGTCLQRLARDAEALASYDRALALRPDFAEALNNRGATLQALRRYDEALASYDQAVALKPGYLEAQSNRGTVLNQLKRFEAAIESYDRALAIKPDYAVAHSNRGNALRDLLRHDEAAEEYEALLRIAPDYPFAAGAAFHSRMQCCDWRGFDANRESLVGCVLAGRDCSTPFILLTASDSPAAQLRCAQTFVETSYPAAAPPLFAGSAYRHDRIRVAYLSTDLREHAVSILLAGVFEQHDRARFEVIAISFGPDDASDMGRRVRSAFDRFIDVRRKTDREVAELLRELEIDIAVDLMGFTGDNRTGILAHRAAPVQVSYLGFPGTMGAPYIDYLFADAYVIPDGQEGAYAENIVRLPDTFQANDAKRKFDQRTPSRAEAGLPDAGFVFCCFNNGYKITPQMFEVWMRLLANVGGSVLWLVKDRPSVETNLRNEAAARGVDPARLVFAPRVPYPQHVARYRLADLFLDTRPFNAGTTASDALWAGLPVLTCSGEAYAARMAGSLLHAIGLPELAIQNLEGYEALALRLATEPELLAGIRARLAQNRATHPLFDTPRFTRHLESAYITMWERHRRGDPPTGFTVNAIDGALPGVDAGELVERGLALHRQGRLEEAEAIYQEILQSRPQHLDAMQLLATIALQRKDPANAVALYDRVLAIAPDFAGALFNRGNALREIGRHAEALESYDRALDIKPDNAEVLNNRGNLLLGLRRAGEALASYERALGVMPDYADAHYNRGNALFALGRHGGAVESYDRALALRPDYADALHNRGAALFESKRNVEALESYERALALRPDYEFLYGLWLYAKMKICDWSDFDANLRRLAEKIENDERASPPFPVLVLSGSPALHRRAAEIWVEARYPEKHPLPAFAARAGGHGGNDGRIRIAYFSADFRNHPVSYLTAELFETHDRSRFEVFGFSIGPDSKDETRKRIAAAFDEFIDVREQPDTEIAALAREGGIDIAIDLGGHTTNSRMGIFAARAAPVQAGYLGYLGTTGAAYLDYLVADSTIVPDPAQRHYTEKIACLPSYQVNDSRRRIADRVFTRAELGLPPTGFVFCCFNNNYKITPATFGIWMRILLQVEGSVLWLYAENETAAANLRKEAGLRGVDPARLVFASWLPPAEYLARYRAADLFLDTLPYNAGTTASDALWAGLPVLTCPGDAFAGRVAASLLTAVHLPQLIAPSPHRYEALAVKFAASPGRLREIRQRLGESRLTSPLFDTTSFTRHLEAAYVAMHERRLAGLPPEHIFVHGNAVKLP